MADEELRARWASGQKEFDGEHMRATDAMGEPLLRHLGTGVSVETLTTAEG